LPQIKQGRILPNNKQNNLEKTESHYFFFKPGIPVSVNNKRKGILFCDFAISYQRIIIKIGFQFWHKKSPNVVEAFNRKPNLLTNTKF